MTNHLRLVLERRESFAEGMAFGQVGPYEKWVGRAEFAVDPEHPAYQRVVDIAYAPRDAAGRVARR